MSGAPWPAPVSRNRWWFLAGGIAALALLASFNGIWNDFTYDDLFIIVSNDVVHDIRRAWGLFFLPYWPIRLGGDGYRPLTLLALAIEWAISPRSPMLFHAVSIAVYVLVSVAVFWLASLLLPSVYAWFAAAFFAVHPVHVEAVANVVGQSELWAALLLVSATALYIHWRRLGELRARHKVVLALIYLAACLFKEHAVVLPVVFLAAEQLILRDVDSFGTRFRQLRPFFLGLLLVGSFYVAFRGLVIHKNFGGFSPFVPFVSLRTGVVDRVLTMLGVVPQWVRLLLWPAALATEYGPPANPIANGLAIWQLPGLILLVGAIGLMIAAARRAPVVSFGLCWMILTLLPSSNFVLPSGILLAERTLFTPSAGAMLAICAALPYLIERLRSSASRVVVLATMECVLVAGSAKSIIQTAVWRTNDTLFHTSVRSSPRVYRSHYMLGAWLMAKQDYALGEREYLDAIALFPRDPFVPYNLGQEYFHAGLYERAYEMYSLAERIMPQFQDAEAQMALTRAMEGRFSDAERLATRALRNRVGDRRTLHAILTAASLDEKSRRRMVEGIANRAAPVMAR